MAEKVTIGNCELVWIYALCDPVTNAPRYVGKTSKPLLQRLKEHKQLARRKAHKGNASGFLGVSSHHGRWKAEIRVGGKLQHIGYFSDAATAGAAYVKAKRELHPTCTI